MQKSIDSNREETLRSRYVKAHYAVSKLEHFYRHHSSGLKKRVRKELKLP